MAVSERNAFAIQLLLDAGADPDMPTRIDETFRFLRAVRGWPLDVTSRWDRPPGRGDGLVENTSTLLDARLAHALRSPFDLSPRVATDEVRSTSMNLPRQLLPVAAVSLVPALVYAAVNDLSHVIADTEAMLIALTALALGAALVWRGLDEYLVEREADVEAMKRFGRTFVREFERPLRQSNGSDRPIESQLRASPDRGRLEILLSPGGGHRYPNLSDHGTNVLYDVTRVLELVHDDRFVCEQLYSKGPWVVVPFQFLRAKKAGTR